MKNLYLFILGINLFLSFSIFGQNVKRAIDPSNTREGETVEYCTSHKKMKALLSNPVEVQKHLANQVLQEQALQLVKSGGIEKGLIYKIPVVFHVLHNNGVENISREQILDALSILNRDYKRLNTDANSVSAPFQGLPVDTEIEFVLATKAPNGTCFSGITRTRNVLTYDGEDGGDQVDAIVAGNDVYNNSWGGNKYLNIFICSEIGGAAGYTTNPWNTGMTNGIWVLHNYVGSIGTSSENTSRTLTHEVGHWLNLSHTWGPNNNPGNTSSCSDDDGVQDTPVCIGVTSCTLNGNSCNDATDPYGYSNWSYDVVDNVENYMDYSYCSKMFTQGQKDRMRAALQSSVGGRNNIWTTSNLNQTGANGVTTVCKADFTLNKTIICAGESVTLSDASYNAPTGWTWTTTGGVPATSNLQNPVIVYNTPGFYTVTLSATDGSTSAIVTKTQVIQVLPIAPTLPYYESFENYTTLNNITSWSVYDPLENRPFTLYTGTGFSGQKCVKLNNFSETETTTDELISSTIDLSSIVAPEIVTLSFRYAYRKKNSTNSEALRIMATTNCGDTWYLRKTFAGNDLSSLISASDWTPSTTSDWSTVHVTSITGTFIQPNFRFKFAFDGKGGNNLFIDDINIYEGSPSISLILSTGELENNSLLSELEVYPNPTESELNVHFSVPNDEDVIIQIQDISGKISQTQLIHANMGSNLVMLDSNKLSSGLYFLNLQVGNSKKTIQFVVK